MQDVAQFIKEIIRRAYFLLLEFFISCHGPISDTMMKKHIYLLLVLVVSIFRVIEADGTFCFPDQMLSASGDCVYCEYCPSGEGVDLNEEVK